MNTVSFRGEWLLNMKKENKADPRALCDLRRAAEAALAAPRYNVVASPKVAESGDPHDYFSMGPYWWPDPEKPDGLPYIRRDGEINPEAVDDNNHVNMATRAFELALAAFWLDEGKYALESYKQIMAWHLDEETYMTPHAEYAQAIPGICSGRGIGIVDFRLSHMVFDAVGILEYMGYIRADEIAALKKWYNAFGNWLLTSEKALTEDTELNNHGTCFDVILLSIARFTERPALTHKVLATAYHRRFVLQTEPNGAQPLELARTCGMHYTLANIYQQLFIAEFAELNGDNSFFERDSERGVCILKSAFDYIYGWAKKPESFPYSEIWWDRIPKQMTIIMKRLDRHFPEDKYLLRTRDFEDCPDLNDLIPR